MTLLQLATDSIDVVSGFTELQRMSSKLFYRLLIDIISVFILIRLVYYPIYKHRDLFFTFFIFNLIIFFVSFLLNKIDISMGAAFGLFAVFSMLRYRTEDISIKDMTYLFLVIAIGLIAAVTKLKNTDDYIEYIFIAIINGIILFITYLLESNILMKKELVKVVLYENIELIKADKKAELLLDLKTRTGFNIHRYSIQKIDFLKDTAQIKIYYYQD
jgi:hypothetical protein